MKAQELGRLGEQTAARALQKMGCRLLAMNYRTRFGEIDLIVQDGDTTVFVEVKTRKDASFAEAAEAVTPASAIGGSRLSAPTSSKGSIPKRAPKDWST